MTMRNGFSHCLKPLLTGIIIIFAIVTTAAGEVPDHFQPASLMTVEAIGTAPTDPKDPAAAQSTATRNALELALDEAVQRLVPPEVLSFNFEIIDSLFYGTTKKYVLNYTVLAVNRQDDYCRVLVRATFADDAMKSRVTSAGVLIDRKITPRILMLISENRPDQPALYWWRHDSGQAALNAVSAAEKAMATIFSKRGLTPLSPTEVLETIEGLSSTADISRDEAIALAHRAGADFVIIGQVEIDPRDQGTGGKQQKWFSRLSARAFSVESGEFLDDFSVEKTSDLAADSDGAEEALTRAGETAAAKLSPSLVTAFQERMQQTRPIDILVRGKNYLNGMNYFQNRLRTLEAVTRFQLTEMRSNQAVLNVTYTGSADNLADALSTVTFEKISITILNVSEEKIILEID